MSKTACDDYFQKLIDIKLESISKMMNDRPGPKTSSKSKQKGLDWYSPYLEESLTSDGCNLRKRSNNCRIGCHPARYLNNCISSANLNLTPKNYLENCYFLEKRNDDRRLNGANEMENKRSDEFGGSDVCSVAGTKWQTNGSSNPEFKADIVSKLKSKAIGNLLFKVKEDMNVKKLNEMKTRPEEMAEKALLLCDLKSYNEFVTELLSSGVFSVAKDRSVGFGKDEKILDMETKQYAAKKEMENLERMVGRVFGDKFLHRSDYRETSFLGARN